MSNIGNRNPAPEAGADLQTQLESLLSVVWDCQRAWEQEDRIDLAVKLGALRAELAS